MNKDFSYAISVSAVSSRMRLGEKVQRLRVMGSGFKGYVLVRHAAQDNPLA